MRRFPLIDLDASGTLENIESLSVADTQALLNIINIGGGANENPNYLHVELTGSDTTGNGSSGKPFRTIAHAYAYGIGVSPTANIPVVIQVGVGTFVENALTLSTAYIHLRGRGGMNTIVSLATGAFTLGSDNVWIEDIGFRRSANVAGAIYIESARYTNSLIARARFENSFSICISNFQNQGFNLYAKGVVALDNMTNGRIYASTFIGTVAAGRSVHSPTDQGECELIGCSFLAMASGAICIDNSNIFGNNGWNAFIGCEIRGGTMATEGYATTAMSGRIQEADGCSIVAETCFDAIHDCTIVGCRITTTGTGVICVNSCAMTFAGGNIACPRNLSQFDDTSSIGFNNVDFEGDHTTFLSAGDVLQCTLCSDGIGAFGKGTVNSVVAGTNVTVNNTDPRNPIVSATGGGSAKQIFNKRISGSGNPTTTSSSFSIYGSDITNPLTLNFTSTGTHDYLFICSLSDVSNTTAAGNGSNIRINLDSGTIVGFISLVPLAAIGLDTRPVMFIGVATNLAAGAHSVSVEWNTGGGSLTARTSTSSMDALVVMEL